MKTINKVLFLCSLMALMSCEDVIEKDISNDTVLSISPQNGATIESNVVNFQWEEIDGADDYRIQVYGADQAISLDSLVSGSHFAAALLEGSYQWRIRAENSAYNSVYSFPKAFSVVAPTVLTNQQVILSSPSNNIYTKEQSLVLSWQPLSLATHYEVEVQNTTSGQAIVYQNNNVTATSVTINGAAIANDANYKWSVRAVNADSQTLFFSRTFSVDRQIPNQPQNTLPANNLTATQNQMLTFNWTMPTDSGVINSPISYTIEFATENAFTNIIQTASVGTTSFQRSFTADGDYYWRVKAVDQAGNIGAYGAVYKITVN